MPSDCRELGFLASLPGLLRLQQPGGNVARQKACNLLCALETVQLLVEARAGKLDAAPAPAAKVLTAETCGDRTDHELPNMLSAALVSIVGKCMFRCMHSAAWMRYSQPLRGADASCVYNPNFIALATNRVCEATQEASENQAACQAALLKAGVLDILIGASLGDGAIASLTVQAQVPLGNQSFKFAGRLLSAMYVTAIG